MTYILLGGLGTILRRLEMVLSLIDVADDIVVHDRVFAGAEVPRLFLWVVRPALQSLQLVLEVQDVVSLFVAEGFVLFGLIDTLYLKLGYLPCSGRGHWSYFGFQFVSLKSRVTGQ